MRKPEPVPNLFNDWAWKMMSNRASDNRFFSYKAKQQRIGRESTMLVTLVFYCRKSGDYWCIGAKFIRKKLNYAF